MSTNDAESGKQAEEEPMTAEGKAKVENNKSSDESKSKSIRAKMIEARNESDGRVDFVTAVLAIIVGSVVGLLALALANIISIAQIVIGSLYIHDCTLRPGIPIILIINGGVDLLQSIAETINKKLETKSAQRISEDQSGAHSTAFLTTFRINVNVLRTIAIASFIAWCVIQYGSGEPEFYDTSSDNYCHKTLYLYSFWLLNFYFIIIALSIFCCCCCCVFANPNKPNN